MCTFIKGLCMSCFLCAVHRGENTECVAITCCSLIQVSLIVILGSVCEVVKFHPSELVCVTPEKPEILTSPYRGKAASLYLACMLTHG